MAEWFSIEVLDGDGSARLWAEVYADSVVWAAQACGATDWEIAEHSWGVLIEIELPSEEWFDALRAEIAFALDAVPDPIGGLLVHRGRGGSAGSRLFRGPRPRLGAGAMALPVPIPAS
jgi:hypothetical protein